MLKTEPSEKVYHNSYVIASRYSFFLSGEKRTYVRISLRENRRRRTRLCRVSVTHILGFRRCGVQVDQAGVLQQRSKCGAYTVNISLGQPVMEG